MRPTLPNLLLCLTLAACGGDNGPQPVTLAYKGTVSGQGCFSGQPMSSPVSYLVTIDRFSPGSSVRLLDAAGGIWQGSMTTESSLQVTRPEGDARWSITLTDVTAGHAQARSITTCVSFRCCDVLTGEVAS